MVYDVRDTGRQLEYGVRRSVTNLDLVFHTDAAWLDLPPELVGLYCINPAREGGVSKFVSLVSVHNELRRRHPALLARLYRPVPWDRQAEHAPDDDKVSRRPGNAGARHRRDLSARHYNWVISLRLEGPAVRHRRFSGVGHVRDDRLGREQQRRDRGRILQRDTLDLGGVDDSRLHHVDVLVGLGVEAARDRDHAPDFLDDHGGLEPGVLHDHPDGFLEGTPHDHDSGALVARELEAVEGLRPA